MFYKNRRQAFYSQNNLCNPELVNKLIRKSSIGKSDTVLEIGAGRGIITRELLRSAGRVIAVELDDKLFNALVVNFRNHGNLKLFRVNFLDLGLPVFPYKVFANIPFIITADIVRRLTDDINFQEGYLVMQKEAAKKFTGMPYASKNSMAAILLKPFFKIDVFWEFERNDFYPRPNVDCVMVYLCRLQEPMIDRRCAHLYRDFVIYTFNRSKVARLSFEKFMKLFERFQYLPSDWQREIISQRAGKILSDQKKIHKIHRTRVDKRWRTYGN